jgi:hypothetical protein
MPPTTIAVSPKRDIFCSVVAISAPWPAGAIAIYGLQSGVRKIPVCNNSQRIIYLPMPQKKDSSGWLQKNLLCLVLALLKIYTSYDSRHLIRSPLRRFGQLLKVPPEQDRAAVSPLE